MPNVKTTSRPPSPRSSGAQQRKHCPRTSLAQWKPELRRHAPHELLERSCQGRIPALVTLKYERMALSPFGFFRGAVPVMAYDLSLMPNTGIETQLCGDAHVQNLGAYAGPDGRLIFDINDFDETMHGPFEWDVKRMASSILLAGQQAKIKPAGCVDAVRIFLSAYCDLIRRFATLPILEVARFQVHRLSSVAPISKILRKAQRSTPTLLLERLTEKTAHGRVFKSDPPILEPLTGRKAEEVLASLPAYLNSLQPERRHFFAQYRPLALAFKVVGTGSVGLRDYCIYMEGNGPDDPLFLQIKQEAPSAYAPYLPNPAPGPQNDGRRTAEGQRAMQLQSDPFLGWTELDGATYLVRQLNDHKASLDVATLTPAALSAYATVCGEMLARGHARSGDARRLAGYIGNGERFPQAILSFAQAYAAQTISDWKALRSLRTNTSAAPTT